MTCTGRCCLCASEEGSHIATSADAEAASAAESVAAAGGSLSEGLSLAVAQQELNNIDELLQLEPDCKGAIDAKCVSFHIPCCGRLSA